MRNIYKPIHSDAASMGLPGRIAQALHIASTFSAAASEYEAEELDKAEAFLKRNSYAALRQLMRDKNYSGIDLGLTREWFPAQICQRLLQEESVEDLRIRLLLMKGISAATNPAHISQKESDTSLAARVRRWNFRLAAQVPELRMILSQWEIVESDRILPAGTDGSRFYVHSNIVKLPDGQRYQFDNYLHTIIHCMFQHTAPLHPVDTSLWNMACDLAAEYHRAEIFSSISKRSMTTSLENLLRQWNISSFPPLPEVLSASALYSWLLQAREQMSADATGEEDFTSWDIFLLEVETAFCLDDHQLWYEAATSPACSHRGEWKKACSSLGQHAQGTRRGMIPGSRQEKMLIREQSQYDFRRYLQRYSTIREELQLDLDSFDYIPYHYGMMMYGNMPMLEPLEYTETSKVEELVIAIDTSGSCDTATVQRFLSETHGMLTRQENFFRKMQVHILQCDSMIHEHVIIHSTEEWQKYIKNIRILGRGGTDFTPVFSYVDKLQREGQLNRLKGLLYFTDGDGIYPKDPTPYETAFVFTNNRFHQYPVPSWIVRLCLEPPEIHSYYAP